MLNIQTTFCQYTSLTSGFWPSVRPFTQQQTWTELYQAR